jgi:putative membrane protein
MSLPLRILLRLILTIVLIWAMQEYLYDYFRVTGGIPAWIVIASLLTLMNLLVRPVLNVIALPLHFLAAILAFILVNAIFMGITVWITGRMEPDLVTMEIQGPQGWIVVPIVLGFANWVMKHIPGKGGEKG